MGSTTTTPRLTLRRPRVTSGPTPNELESISHPSLAGPPKVDPSIRGIPQGWEDDIAIPLQGDDVNEESHEETRRITDHTRNRLRDRVKIPYFGTKRSKRDPKSDMSTSKPNESMNLPHHAPHLVISTVDTSSSFSTTSTSELALEYPSAGHTFDLPVDQALPFSSSRPYSAWDLAQKTQIDEGWTTARRRGKRTGRGLDLIYKVGWTREVLDMEARLHQTMFELFGRHSWVETEPQVVLDIGTGIGLWPISQAGVWQATRFIGFDIAPCQPELTKLNRGAWTGLADRIIWQRGDFNQTLPFDSGSFDMVHIRFVGLGVPEAKWPTLLEEASRVLKPGGNLEIVERSYDLPIDTALAPSVYSIQPDPSLAIKFALPFTPGLKCTPPRYSIRAMPMGAFQDANYVWADSATERPPRQAVYGRLTQELRQMGWKFTNSATMDERDVSISIWVIRRI